MQERCLNRFSGNLSLLIREYIIFLICAGVVWEKRRKDEK